MPEKEAKKLAKKNPDLTVLLFDTDFSVSSKKKGILNTTYRNVSSGFFVGISAGRGNPLVSQYLPTYGKRKEVSDEIVAFGLDALQYLCKTMDERQMKSNMSYRAVYRQKAPALQGKKLYLPEEWVNEKLPKETIEEIYQFPVEVVSYEEWRKTILERTPGVAYAMIVPKPQGGDYVYTHHLVDAETGDVYGVTFPKASVKIMGINLSKSNSGYIEDKTVEMYQQVALGEW